MCAIKVHNGALKLWSLLASGRYLEMVAVVSSGLTVFIYFVFNLEQCFKLKQKLKVKGYVQLFST